MKLVKVPSEKLGITRITYCNEIQPIETFVEHESAIDFRGFEALHNVVLDIDDNRFAPMFKRKVDIQYV